MRTGNGGGGGETAVRGGGGSAADQNNVKVKQTAALSLGSLATVPESGAASRQEAGKSRVHGAEAKTI